MQKRMHNVQWQQFDIEVRYGFANIKTMNAGDNVLCSSNVIHCDVVGFNIVMTYFNLIEPLTKTTIVAFTKCLPSVSIDFIYTLSFPLYDKYFK